MKNEQSLERKYANLIFNRKLLLLAHVLLGFFLFLSYLTHLHLGGLQYWQPRGIAILLLAGPVLLPLVVSAIYSRHVVSDRGLPVYVYLLLLVAGSVATILFYDNSLELGLNGFHIMLAVTVQTFVYVGSAKLLLK